MAKRSNLSSRVGKAIEHFWRTRSMQQGKQGGKSETRDRGARSAVTGGKQLDGFIKLISELLFEAGLPDAAIQTKAVLLPGYFRPTKEWDLLIILNGLLFATIEFKSHVGPSFGNNFNNRAEEAIGSATDFWTAYRENAFQASPRP